MSALAKILKDVRLGIKLRAKSRPLDMAQIPKTKRKSLMEAIEKAPKVPLIAEIKRASPSMGEINPTSDVLEVARAMLRGGAIALSVLTEPKHFKGDPNFLREVKSTVSVPVLCKDFIIDEYQILEAAELGADAVLLIVKILGEKTRKFMQLAEDLGMECLVEVTDEEEIKIAISAGAKLVGINNRNLETLKVDLNRTVRLAPLIPEDMVLVSESGINTPGDVKRMLDAGADAVLVGTAIMRAGDIEQKVRSLVEAR